MTSIEYSVLQVSIICLLAPLCTGLLNTIVTLVQQKTWIFPWSPWRRGNDVIAAASFGTTLMLMAILPLLRIDGLAGTEGNTFVVIALMAIIGGSAAIMSASSLIPMVLCAVGTAMLSLAIATSSVNGSDSLLALANDTRPAIVLIVVAVFLALVALRNDVQSERTNDVRMVLQTGIGVYVVNLLTLMTVGNMLSHPTYDGLIFAGKILVATLVVDLLAAGVRRHERITPQRLVRTATFLSILSIIVTLWQLNPSL